MFVLPVCHSVPWNEILRKHAENHALLSHAAFPVQMSCGGPVTGLSGRHANPKVLFWVQPLPAVTLMLALIYSANFIT